MKALLAPLMARLLTLVRGIGPYAAIELLLPGGSLIALLIWFYRSRRVGAAGVLVSGSLVPRQKQSTWRWVSFCN